MGVLPSSARRSAVGLAGRRSGQQPRSSMSRRLPQQRPRRAAHGRLDAPARDGLEVRDVGQSAEPAGLGLLDDGLAQRMLRAALGRRRQAEQFAGQHGPSTRRPPAAGRASPATTMSVTSGLPRVSVPVLSRTIDVELVRPLQRLARADEDAVLGSLAGAHHDGRGRGQAHGAGAGDDHHGDEGEQGQGEGGLRPEEVPDQEGDHGDRRAPPARRCWRCSRPAAGWAPWSPEPPPPGGRSGRERCRARPWWPGSGTSRSG